jgi:hypothetical protein
MDVYYRSLITYHIYFNELLTINQTKDEK